MDQSHCERWWFTAWNCYMICLCCTRVSSSGHTGSERLCCTWVSSSGQTGMERLLYLGEQQRTDRDGDTGNWCLKLALQQKTTDDSVSTHEWVSHAKWLLIPVAQVYRIWLYYIDTIGCEEVHTSINNYLPLAIPNMFHGKPGETWRSWWWTWKSLQKVNFTV